MKNKEPLTIVPGPTGWLVGAGAAAWREVDDLGAIAAGAGDAASVTMALPAWAAVFERMQLPATDPAELAGMVRLQLEKTLPYPPEEITSTWLPVRKGEDGSVVLGVAVHQAQLDEVCGPLLERDLYPTAVTVWVAHVAAACPPGETVLAVFAETGKVVLAVVEDRKLGWVDVVGADGPDETAAPGGPGAAGELERLAEALPGRLLAAELGGVPTTFSRVLVDDACRERARGVGEALGAPVSALAVGRGGELTAPPRLLPAVWREAAKRARNRLRLRARLLSAAIIYLVLLVAVLGLLVWMQVGVDRLDRRLAQLRPRVAEIQGRQERWRELAPAIEPALSTVEIMQQVLESLPSEEVRITMFDQTPAQFMIEGEAPSAAMAVELLEKLKGNAALGGFAFEAGAPTLLPNEHAQFRIFGKR